MVEFKCVINDPKTGKSYSKPCNDESLVGKKIKDTVKGEVVGLKDYELIITGGSDNAGFPMRPDVGGPERKKALLTGGTGIKIKRKGAKIRKTVRGNTVSKDIVQINFKISKAGKESIEKLWGLEEKSEEEKPEEEKKE